MGLSSELTEYPICDTDIWIKVSKIRLKEIIFHKHERIHMSDAVSQELKKKTRDDVAEFGGALKLYSEEAAKKKIHYISLDNPHIFTSNEKNRVKVLFVAHKISYDDKTGLFIDDRNHLGEKVSAIYASILGLNLILSDDSGCGDFVKKYFGYLSVTNLKELLDEHGLQKNEIDKYLAVANSKVDETKDKTAKPKLNDMKKSIFKN